VLYELDSAEWSMLLLSAPTVEQYCDTETACAREVRTVCAGAVTKGQSFVEITLLPFVKFTGLYKIVFVFSKNHNCLWKFKEI
jgi:hypothetical protein